jgi:hypothetical protein
MLLTLAATWPASAIERAAWSQRVEADWLLAEEVAAQDQLGGPVTTKADAAGGCDAGCLPAAKSCADACRAQSATCQSNCGPNPVCKNGCTQTEQTCIGACVQKCVTCGANAGCPISMGACQDATI